jgi:hypothetical protein
MNTKREKEKNRFQLPWNICNKDGDRVGAAAYAEDAAAFVSIIGDGATVQIGCLIVWREGELFDGNAADSYDGAAEKMWERARRGRFGL